MPARRVPSPPVGPALGQHGINIMEFCKAFNAQTQSETGTVIPVVITVYEDRSFTFITKTPPAAVLIKQALRIGKGSGEPNRNKVGTITQEQLREIAERKLDDLNAHDVDQAAKIIAGHRPLDGRRGGVMTRPRPRPQRARSRASTASASTRRPRRSRSCAASRARSSTSRSKCTCAPALNVRHADEQLRGTIALPNGLGKEVRDRGLRQRRQGARGRSRPAPTVVGGDDLAKRIEEGFDDFDVTIADAGHDAHRRPPRPRSSARRARCRTRKSAP